MATSIVKALVLKDLFFIKWPMLGYIAIGIFASFLFASESMVSTQLGMVLIIAVICIVSAQLIFTTVVGERKHQTLAFIMSLPVSNKEYVSSKMLVNILGYVIPWLLISAGVILAIYLSNYKPNGLVPFASIILLELFLAHIFVLTTSMIFESELITVISVTISNIAISLFIFFIASFPEIHQYMEGSKAVWNITSISIIGIELITILALVGTIYYAQSKKKHFI